MFAYMLLRQTPGSLHTYMAALSKKKFQAENDKQAQLKGKAFQIRDCVGPILEVCKAKMDRSSKADRLLKICLTRSLEFNEVVRTYLNDPVLDPEVRNKLVKITAEFVAVYQEMNVIFTEKGYKYFALTKKLHDLCHLAERATEVNPAWTSCMLQEDLMGKVKVLMVNSVQGCKPTVAALKALRKYRLGLHLEHSP